MARKLAIRSRYAISRVTYARAGPPGPLPRCASRLLTKLYRDYGEVLARGERWALSVDVGRDDDECRLTRVVPLRWSSGFPDRYLSGSVEDVVLFDLEKSRERGVERQYPVRGFGSHVERRPAVRGVLVDVASEEGAFLGPQPKTCSGGLE